MPMLAMMRITTEHTTLGDANEVLSGKINQTGSYMHCALCNESMHGLCKMSI